MFFKTHIQWVKVFNSHEEFTNRIVGENIIHLQVEGRTYCAANNEGELVVFEERCPHQKAQLIEGACKNGEIICPWHKYAFSCKEGKDLSTAGNALKVYQTKLIDNQWHIGIELRMPFWMDPA